MSAKIASLLFFFGVLSVSLLLGAVKNIPNPGELIMTQHCATHESILRKGGLIVLLAGDPDGLLVLLRICQHLR